MNIESKENWWKKSFSYETNTSLSLSFIPMRRMCVWCPTMKRKEIITYIKFVPIERWTSILRKMIEKKTFLMKPKHHYHLSQWGECVYNAQSRMKRRLLHVSMFVLIDRQTLTLGKRWKEKIFLWTKASMSRIVMRRVCLWCPIKKRKEIIMCIDVCPY